MGGHLAVVAALLAALPDIDLAFGDTHRTFTHSFFTAAIVGLAAALVAARQGWPVLRTGLVCGSAWASHVLFDWLGSDHSTPLGVMAFWPLDTSFYRSPIALFPTVEHRYWLVERFIRTNALAFVWEVAVMGSVLALVWSWRRKAPVRL